MIPSSLLHLYTSLPAHRGKPFPLRLSTLAHVDSSVRSAVVEGAGSGAPRYGREDKDSGVPGEGGGVTRSVFLTGVKV